VQNLIPLVHILKLEQGSRVFGWLICSAILLSVCLLEFDAMSNDAIFWLPVVRLVVQVSMTMSQFCSDKS
jgi:hypothetical protein